MGNIFNFFKRNNKFHEGDLVVTKVDLPSGFNTITSGSVCKITSDGFFFERKTYDIEDAEDTSKWCTLVNEEDLELYEI